MHFYWARKFYRKYPQLQNIRPAKLTPIRYIHASMHMHVNCVIRVSLHYGHKYVDCPIRVSYNVTILEYIDLEQPIIYIYSLHMLLASYTCSYSACSAA